MYLNEIGAPEGSWSLDDGDPKTERCFEKVLLYGEWESQLSSRVDQPRAWLEANNGAKAYAYTGDDIGHLTFRYETGMVER